LKGAAPAEGEAIFPRAGGFEDSPVTGFSVRANSGEWVDEGFFFAKGEEREVGARVAVALDSAGDAELGEAGDFCSAFVILSDEIGEEIDFLSPVKAGAEAEVKAEGFSDVPDPELRAGGREDEAAAGLAVVLDLCDDLGVGEPGKPVLHESGSELIEALTLHAPEVAVEDALHPAGSEELIEGEK